MKIISKYKDYYDYLQGIWGVDEKLVLDRTEITKTLQYGIGATKFPYIQLIRFYICGNVVEGVFYRESENSVGDFLYGEEIEGILGSLISTTDSKWYKKDQRYFYIKNIHSKWLGRYIEVLKKPTPFFDLDHYPEKTYYMNLSKVECPNDLYNCPILIEQIPVNRQYNLNACCKFPVLKDHLMHKVYSAQDMWIMLGEWLGREKEIPNNQTNGEKVLSNGFDLKTSFRNPIK